MCLEGGFSGVVQSGESAPAVATATLAWVDARGARWTTLVAKLTAALVPGSAAALVSPAPLVHYDRLAPDRVRVVEAAEVFPFSRRASVFLTGGPLRLVVGGPAAGRTFEVDAGEPVGLSMSAPERKALVSSLPTRTGSGDLIIPDLDPDYFTAAFATHRLDTIRGDEAIALETPRGRVAGTLPGLALVARIAPGVVPARFVALQLDMLVMDGAAGRVSLVARAPVRGAFARFDVMVGPLSRLTTSDHGDDPLAPQSDASTGGAVDVEETQQLTPAAIASLRGRAATPFASSTSAASGPKPRSAGPAIAATPFDAEFRPAAVLPAADTEETLPAAGAHAAQLARDVKAWLTSSRSGIAEDATVAADVSPASAQALPSEEAVPAPSSRPPWRPSWRLSWRPSRSLPSAPSIRRNRQPS